MRNNQAMENALKDARRIMRYHGYMVDNFNDARQKESLYNHLRTFPTWNESELRLSVTINHTTYKLGAHQRNILGDMVFSPEILRQHTTHATILFMLSEILRYNLTRNYEFLYDQQFGLLQAHAKEIYNLNIRDNVKPSKLVASVFKKVGMTESDTKNILDYLSCYAPSATERTYYISINPLDCLTMSNGNTWHSCQLLVGENARNYGAGCYGQGCISLWRDDCTAILYEESSDYDTLTPDIERPYKRGRRLLNYGNNGILIQKGYGDFDGHQAISVLKTLYPDGREVEESYFNECVDIKGAHYDDFGINSFFYNLPESLDIFPVSAIATYNCISVGSAIHCVRCGEWVNYYDEIINGDQCNECQMAVCHGCGHEIYPDDAIAVDWDLYCPDCVERCDDCGEYFLPNQLMELGGYTYCESCAENNSIMCEMCGQVVHCDDAHQLDNGLWVCGDCIDDEIE